MVLAPLAQEWDAGIWNVPMPEPGPEHVLPWQPYREAQQNWAQEQDIPIVSFPELFSSYNGDKRKLFVDNMHPSREGHMLMARKVADFLGLHPELLQLSRPQSPNPPR